MVKKTLLSFSEGTKHVSVNEKEDEGTYTELAVRYREETEKSPYRKGAKLGEFIYIGDDKHGEIYKVESIKHPDKFYETRHNTNPDAVKKWGVFSCNCPAWVFHKNSGKKECLHTKRLQSLLNLVDYLAPSSTTGFPSEGNTNIIGIGLLGIIVFGVLALAGFTQKK